MIVNNHVLSDFKSTHNVDNTHADSEKIRYYGKDVTLGSVRETFNRLAERPKNMVVFYDNMFQYTSLGLLDLIYEIKDISAPLPIKDFFNRTELGNDFVKKVSKLWDISPKEIDTIEKENYMEILKRSPLSNQADAFIKMRKGLRSQLFVFKYPVEGITDLFNEIKSKYLSATGEYVSIEIDFLYGKSIEEYLSTFSESRQSRLEYVAIEDAGSLMAYIDSKKIEGTEILTYPLHNGLIPEQIEKIMDNEQGFGYGDYIVKFMKEGR